MKERAIANVKSDNLYRYYKKTSKYSPVERKVFGEIIRKFNTAIIDAMIYKAFEFHFPARLGTIRIKKIKIKVKMNDDGTIDKRYLAPDWKATKELWNKDEDAKNRKQLVYHLNRHTNGYKHRFFWNKQNSNVRNQTIYTLDMARYSVKRRLAAALKNTKLNLNYYE